MPFEKQYSRYPKLENNRCRRTIKVLCIKIVDRFAREPVISHLTLVIGHLSVVISHLLFVFFLWNLYMHLNEELVL